jgi:SAM-dependent methyltransferase
MISQESTVTISANLEYPVCPVCGSERRQISFHLRDPYSVARCTSCGFYYLYPRVIEGVLQEAYRQPSYYEGGDCGYADTSYTAQESALRATFKCLLHNLAERRVTGGALLEIGCGYGYLLDEARAYFDRRVGTEFSVEGAEIARSTGAEVFVGGIEQICAERKFDCILAIQVIEHVYQPLTFVKQLIRLAQPGGHIVFATPDMGGVLRKVMGRYWPSFKVPEHVGYFDSMTLSRLMEKAGLSDVRPLPYPHAFPLGLLTAKFGLNIRSVFGRLKIWVPATTVAVYGRLS